MLQLAEAGGEYFMPHRSVWVYDSVWSKIVRLQRGVEGFRTNRFWNQAALEYIVTLDVADEGLKLDAEIEMLIQLLDTIHREQKAVLRHGSYVIAYMKELKGIDVKRLVTDLPPYNVKRDRPNLTDVELELIERMVIYRRVIAEKLRKLLNRRMDLRDESLDPELVDRVRQSLKVGDLPRRSRRVPENADGFIRLPPGTATRTPEELRRLRSLSGDPVMDDAFKKAWAVEDEIRRKREAESDAEEGEEEET